MPEAAKAVPKTTSPAGDAKGKETGEEKAKTPRTNFSELWPKEKAIKALVPENPKKKDSKARARFAHYYTSKTVGDYLEAGGTYQDIAYDIARNFIQVG